MTTDKEELVRCIRCGSFVPYEEAYVHSHEVDEDGETIENCVCSVCKEEEYY